MRYSDLLEKSLKKLNIEFNNEQIQKFNAYYELLIEWNNKINLTTITEYDDVVSKHFIDSILICGFIDLSGKKIIDIGTGGGFPGIPIKIISPDTNIVLLDSLNKRVNFLNEVISELKLEKIEAIHGRAEDLAHDKNLRGKFDYSISRAVANLSTLSELCIPFLKKGGTFISYKSENTDEEIKDAESAIKILGSKIERVEESIIPENDIKRRFILIKNIKQVDNRYPRKAGIPKKDPL